MLILQGPVRRERGCDAVGATNPSGRQLVRADDGVVQEVPAEPLQTLLWLLPSGCTDEVQAIDGGYGQLLKVDSGKRLDEWVHVEQNFDNWVSGNFPASGRHILLTHMVEQSINVMNKQNELNKQAFQEDGDGNDGGWVE